MTSPKTRRLKTVDDYMALDDDQRVELIQGEFFVTPSPTYRHQRILVNLLLLLRQYVLEKSLGEVCVAPLDVIFPSGEVVQPDLLFISKANSGIVQDRIRGVPDLVVEIVSSVAPERDRIVKRDLYARNGVGEYWIVDDTSSTIEVLSLDGASYRAHGYFESDDSVTSPTLAELSLPVAKVFE